MTKKFEGKEETFDIQRDLFKNFTDNYVGVSKMWDQSYTKLYKPWMEFMGESTGKLSDISLSAGPKKYKDFYDDWMTTYQNTFGKFSPTQVPEPRETLEKFVKNAEESNKIYMSWVNELGENTKKTTEVLNTGSDPAKYRECLDMWRKSYEKMSDDLLGLPAFKYQKEIFENVTGIPDFYSDSFEKTRKLWKDSYARLYDPWFESMQKLSDSIVKLSKGGATPEAYKEFYDIWMDSYKETYGKMFDPFSMKPGKELFDSFQESVNISLGLYKGWIDAMEKMSEKFKDQSKFTADPEAFKEFFNLWLKMYEKATDDFFEGMPAVGPIKEMMEPIRNACKIYASTSLKMSKLWLESYSRAAKSVQG